MVSGRELGFVMLVVSLNCRMFRLSFRLLSVNCDAGCVSKSLFNSLVNGVRNPLYRVFEIEFEVMECFSEFK